MNLKALFTARWCRMSEGSNHVASNKLQKSIGVLLLAGMVVSVHALGASLFGETARSSARAPVKLSGELIVNGSSTMAPMLMEIGKRFEALHPGTRIVVLGDATAVGISDVRQGKASIGALSRALSDAEKDLTPYPIGRDGVCVIVHKTNPIATLSDQQMVDIFTGKTVNWKRVGGGDAAIDVINGIAGSGAVDVFLKYFKIKYDDIKPHLVAPNSSARVTAVAADRNGISYVSLGEADRKMKAGVPIKLLPAGGTSATKKALRSGNFPISRPLTLYTSGMENELTTAFIRYVLSPSANAVIDKFDFVPYSD
jgi:phosphate transport system substrate-binding protein